MKELSIEEKAKRYDEATERAKRVLLDCTPEEQKVVEYIYPKLKESEGEKIRIDLINYFNGAALEHREEEVLAWLEKQDEQKPAIIIPKFKVGDEIKIANEESLTITKIDGKGYWSEDLFICCFDEECVWDLVEHNPAWSEEDKMQLDSAIHLVSNTGHFNTANWLKSPKDRYTWKPSEEMLEALYRAIPENVMEISEDEMLLDKLYQGLKYGRVLGKN